MSPGSAAKGHDSRKGSGPKVSVLMVNYNGGEVLERALGHLMAVEDQWHEVILADNGSTDGSLSRVQAEFPAVRILRLGANLGFGTANNRAAAEAEGDLLLLLNSDAWLKTDTLPALIQALDDHPKAALAAPSLVYPDGKPQFHWAPLTSVMGEAVQLIRNRLEGFSFIHRLRFGAVGWYTGACMLLRREAFQAVGGFDEDFFLYFEDVDLCIRLRRQGWDLVDVPEVQAVHVKGGSQGQSKVGTQLNYRLGQARYYRKHRPPWEQRFLRLKIRRKLPDAEARVLLDRVYQQDLSQDRSQDLPGDSDSGTSP